MKERRAIVVRGIVQGVGFRPFVYGLASRLDLNGFVKNDTGGVWIEVEGDSRSLDRFVAKLACDPPPLARIDQVSWERQSPRGDREFHIQASDSAGAGPVFISPDVATCDACLAEMLDPADRRYLYPFLNCTHCGPRLTIITGAPYDRERTTMGAFPLCPDCRAEYEDPSNRRFHAQPTACSFCGPSLQVLDSRGQRIANTDPLAFFVSALRAGRIGALKGLGGYHLACDARREEVVAELRRRKHRDEKPFAIMVGDMGTAEVLCHVSPGERDLLLSRGRPIVLLRKRDGASNPQVNGHSRPVRSDRLQPVIVPPPAVTTRSENGPAEAGHYEQVAEAVAPRNPYLGVMLPYTPLHHLLVRAMEGIPLVMTSGNRSDEPIAYDDHDAIERLAGIADVFLVHNRPIHVRCDDSVTRLVAGVELPLRRSRGYAPQPIALPVECPQPILAVGGQLKGTFALGRGRHAFVSHHLGDLDHFEAYRAFVRDIGLYQELFGIQPEVLVHDLHPDYASTRYALERAGCSTGVIAVQHHHAHMASCMAEHRLTEPVIGVTFDGTGLGTDGTVWGGEFLVGDYRDFRRAAFLRPVGLPGGDQAIHEPWRMAVAHLADAGLSPAVLQRHGGSATPAASRVVEKMLERRFNTPLTSSAGRLFDAVAALAGVRDRVRYEGQAAIELEWLATGSQAEGAYPFEAIVKEGAPSEPTFVIDTRPLIRGVADDVERRVEPRLIARRFHSTVVELIAAVCGRLRQASGLEAVVLSGGVFLNALLTEEVVSRLTGDGFRVYRHRLVPPNDGGLSLGQLAVAAARVKESGVGVESRRVG